ncbi:MAG: hypothetical protein ACI9O2_001181, partial [Flammeovirgaceae bacterium]
MISIWKPKAVPKESLLVEMHLSQVVIHRFGE